jgi:hypothetical protein
VLVHTFFRACVHYLRLRYLVKFPVDEQIELTWPTARDAPAVAGRRYRVKRLLYNQGNTMDFGNILYETNGFQYISQ